VGTAGAGEEVGAAAHLAGYDAWCTAYVFAHYLYDRGGGRVRSHCGFRKRDT
jgi:hypothetical protein